MGKSIKSECVIQILSRLQKYEQVLEFPTHILSAQSGCVSAHKWFNAAWGPAAVGGGRIIFSSLQWPWPADWAIPFSPGQSGSAETTTWALGPKNPHFSCFVCSSPQSALKRAICLVGLRAAAGLLCDPQLDFWLQNTKRDQRKREKSW